MVNAGADEQAGVTPSPEPRVSDDARFSLGFAPAAKRPALVTLIAYEERLAAVLPHVEEPHIPLIKLAWWRDAIAKLADHPAAGEPLLEEVRASLDSELYPRLADMAEAHMDRIETGDRTSAARALLAGGAGILNTKETWDLRNAVPGPLRPVSAVLAVRPLAGRAPTRRHLRIIRHMMTGRMPPEALR